MCLKNLANSSGKSDPYNEQSGKFQIYGAMGDLGYAYKERFKTRAAHFP